MNKILPKLAIALLVAILSVGCDKLCKKNVADVATIQNATGRQLSLNVCKGRSYGEVSATISQDTLVNEVSLGSRQGSEVRGGPTASCSGVSDEKSTPEISLAPSSFGQVKLCFDDINKRNLIIENHQSCPVGYLEQTSTGPCIE